MSHLVMLKLVSLLHYFHSFEYSNGLPNISINIYFICKIKLMLESLFLSVKN